MEIGNYSRSEDMADTTEHMGLLRYTDHTVEFFTSNATGVKYIRYKGAPSIIKKKAVQFARMRDSTFVSSMLETL